MHFFNNNNDNNNGFIVANLKNPVLIGCFPQGPLIIFTNDLCYHFTVALNTFKPVSFTNNLHFNFNFFLNLFLFFNKQSLF